VRLLVSDSDELRELLLGEAEYCPAFAHARANVAVERLHTTPTGTGLRTRRRGIVLLASKETLE
jgi:hypothetical protein